MPALCSTQSKRQRGHVQPLCLNCLHRITFCFFRQYVTILDGFGRVLDIDNYSWTEIWGFWVFLHKETLLCPFLLVSFRFSWSQTMNFGLFSQDLRHYVHFRHRHLRFLQYCDLFLDIFASLMLPYVHFHLQPFTFRGRRQ